MKIEIEEEKLKEWILLAEEAIKYQIPPRSLLKEMKAAFPLTAIVHIWGYFLECPKCKMRTGQPITEAEMDRKEVFTCDFCHRQLMLPEDWEHITALNTRELDVKDL